MPQNVSYGIQGGFFRVIPVIPRKQFFFTPEKPLYLRPFKGAKNTLHGLDAAWLKKALRAASWAIVPIVLKDNYSTSAPRKGFFFLKVKTPSWQLKDFFKMFPPRFVGKSSLNLSPCADFSNRVGEKPPTMKHSGKLIWAELRANQKWITNFPYQMTSKIVNTSSFMVHFPWLS